MLVCDLSVHVASILPMPLHRLHGHRHRRLMPAACRQCPHHRRRRPFLQERCRPPSRRCRRLLRRLTFSAPRSRYSSRTSLVRAASGAASRRCRRSLPPKARRPLVRPLCLPTRFPLLSSLSALSPVSDRTLITTRCPLPRASPAFWIEWPFVCRLAVPDRVRLPAVVQHVPQLQSRGVEERRLHPATEEASSRGAPALHASCCFLEVPHWWLTEVSLGTSGD